MKTNKIAFSEAINDATIQAMELEKNVFVFGIGVDKHGNIFGTTKNIKEKFGSDRIFDTPSSEQALTALAAGAANANLRPILVHQRLDFMIYSFDQIINWISLWSFKSSKRSKMPLTIRAVVGKGWGQGPQHAKSLHSIFAHIPGLQVVMPSTPFEAKGLLLSSIFSNDPTIFIEGRSLFSMEEEVPNEPYFIELGKAKICKKGNDITLVSFGSAMPLAFEAAKFLSTIDISVEVIDLRSIKPIDKKTILDSVSKTKNLIVFEPGWKSFSTSSEIIAFVCEKIGNNLSNNPKRVCWPDSHVPMSSPLENNFYPSKSHLINEIKMILKK